jgi:hypothetical protein
MDGTVRFVFDRGDPPSQHMGMGRQARHDSFLYFASSFGYLGVITRKPTAFI